MSFSLWFVEFLKNIHLFRDLMSTFLIWNASQGSKTGSPCIAPCIKSLHSDCRLLERLLISKHKRGSLSDRKGMPSKDGLDWWGSAIFEWRTAKALNVSYWVEPQRRPLQMGTKCQGVTLKVKAECLLHWGILRRMTWNGHLQNDRMNPSETPSILMAIQKAAMHSVVRSDIQCVPMAPHASGHSTEMPHIPMAIPKDRIYASDYSDSRHVPVAIQKRPVHSIGHPV